MINNKKGFTLVECMIVIIIVSILVIIWNYYGRNNIKVAAMNEGRMFIEKIVAQEKIYMSEHGKFIKTPGNDPVCKLDDIFLDASSMNKYYRSFKISIGPDILVIEMYPDLDRYPDFSNFLVKGVYKTNTNKIEFNETYGE